MDKFCAHCGAPLAEDAKFCGNCGKEVGVPSTDADFDAAAACLRFSNRDYHDVNPADEHTMKEKYFSYRGRLNRKRYFFRSIAEFLAFVVLVTLSMVILPLLILVIPAAIAVIISGIMLTIRRCHDLDKSGWFYLFLFVPVADFIVTLYLLLAKGTEGPNHYGPDPLIPVSLWKH